MTTLHPTALEILDIVEQGGYRAPSGKWVEIGALQSAATARTETFSPEDLEAPFAAPGTPGATPRQAAAAGGARHPRARPLRRRFPWRGPARVRRPA